jgi:hypothetical protein
LTHKGISGAEIEHCAPAFRPLFARRFQVQILVQNPDTTYGYARVVKVWTLGGTRTHCAGSKIIPCSSKKKRSQSLNALGLFASSITCGAAVNDYRQNWLRVGV